MTKKLIDKTTTTYNGIQAVQKENLQIHNFIKGVSLRLKKEFYKLGLNFYY